LTHSKKLHTTKGFVQWGHDVKQSAVVIEHAGKSDTMTANYPYKDLKGFKRKFDPSYNYFYRTIVYNETK
jgi:hypothetical protein